MNRPVRRHGGGRPTSWRVPFTPIAFVMLVAGMACRGDGPITSANGHGSSTAPPSTSGGGAGSPTCSVAALGATPPDLPDLPADVAQTRQRIVAAATACNFDRLGEIASADGSGFTFSFGNGGEPAQHWRRLELTGDEPLRYLVELLSRPYRRVPGAAPAIFAWPSAHGFDDWNAVPKADREALRPLYGDSDLASFDAAGTYLGYRIGIRQDGAWLYFVAGD